jgi:hypothetical protein
VTAKDSKGKELFRQSRIYMPIPQQLGRGDKMGRGPYEKSGILRDSSLPPNRPVNESFEIPFPAEFAKKDGKNVTTILDHDMTIDVELMYLPFGTKESGQFTWHKVTKKVSIEKGGV